MSGSKLTPGISREVKLSESLSRLIKAKDLVRQQKKIASDLKISEGALSHYLKGRSTPSFENLLRMAEYFEVSLDYLVFGDTRDLNKDGDASGFVAQQVQAALNEAQAISARKQDLVSRLAQVMIGSLDKAVDDIVAHPVTSAKARTISNSEAVLLERSAISVAVMSGWPNEDPATGRQSGTSTVTQSGELLPGPFLEVQSNNIKNGVQYRQLVQGAKGEWQERARRVRRNLSSAGVSTEQLSSNHLMKGNSEPIISTVVILRVSEQKLSQSAKVIWERFRPYFRADGLFAYLSIMDDLFKGGIPLAERYRDSAEEIFNRMWQVGEDI